MDEQANKLNLEELLVKDPAKRKICSDIVQSYILANDLGFIGIHRVCKQIDYLGKYYVALIKDDAEKAQKYKKKFNPKILRGFYSEALELAENAISSAERYAKLAKPTPEESADKIIKEKESIGEEAMLAIGLDLPAPKISEFQKQLHVKAAYRSREKYIEQTTTELQNANYYRIFAIGIKQALNEKDSFASNDRRLNAISNAMLDIAEQLGQLDVKVQFGESPVITYTKSQSEVKNEPYR